MLEVAELSLGKEQEFIEKRNEREKDYSENFESTMVDRRGRGRATFS